MKLLVSTIPLPIIGRTNPQYASLWCRVHLLQMYFIGFTNKERAAFFSLKNMEQLSLMLKPLKRSLLNQDNSPCLALVLAWSRLLVLACLWLCLVCSIMHTEQGHKVPLLCISEAVEGSSKAGTMESWMQTRQAWYVLVSSPTSPSFGHGPFWLV